MWRVKVGLRPGPPDLAHWPVQEAGQGTQVKPGRNPGRAPGGGE